MSTHTRLEAVEDRMDDVAKRCQDLVAHMQKAMNRFWNEEPSFTDWDLTTIEDLMSLIEDGIKVSERAATAMDNRASAEETGG